MTETATTRNSTSLRPGHNHRRRRAVLPVRRFALGVAAGLALAASLLATSTACSGGHGGPPQQINVGPTQQKGIQIAETITGGQQIDTFFITDHLYLNGPDGMTFEISVGKDANGKDIVTATRVSPK